MNEKIFCYLTIFSNNLFSSYNILIDLITSFFYRRVPMVEHPQIKQFQFSQGYDVKQLKKISIVIPTRNEEGTIQRLVERIALICKKFNIQYEVVIIDDHSTDKTFAVAKNLHKEYPVSLYTKKGDVGKAQSLLEGFSYASYPLICMIDGDLQYPPEAIPLMLKQIYKGADIVVANRIKRETSFTRKFISNTFLYIFGKYLHGFSCDIQSGLKLFKKEIIERIQLHPSPWTFDLEFLSNARDAGYAIGTIPIVFEKRPAGKSKVQLFNTSLEIGFSAIKQKLSRPKIIPFHPTIIKKKGKGFHFKGKEFLAYTDLSPMDTAFFRLSYIQKIFLVCFIISLAISFIVNFHATLIVLIASVTALYFTDLLFQMFLIYKSFADKSELFISQAEVGKKRDRWPTYTILCPLYKEAMVIPQFITAIKNLSYPKDKLQVLLILEEDDKETIAKASSYHLPYFMRVIIAPHSRPKTKPKALNYGLRFAKGEYLVVYDAEDIPDPDQLKKVICAFEKVDNKIVCIQAKLNFYNPHQNILTRIFTAEYSLWFDLILTGLQAVNAPIPLGGTSNHFRVKDITKLQGWDAFNVTEDCDLGIRLAQKGFRTAIINSTTFEEANSEITNWIAQRGRWIKGYMQTYLVHTRNLFTFFRLSGKAKTAMFQLIVGGRVFSLLINPIMWITAIIYFCDRAHVGTIIESFFPAPVLYIGTLSFIGGNFLYLYYYMIGAAKRGQFSIIKYTLFTPFYWLMMSVTAWQALYKIVLKPHYWAKTKHGLHLKRKRKIVLKVSEKLINRNIFQLPGFSLSD